MTPTDLTLQETIEISRLYTDYSNSDLQSAIYQSIAYDWVNAGDEYFSITGYQLLNDLFIAPVNGLIQEALMSVTGIVRIIVEKEA